MSSVAIWVWFCALLNCTGWALSAVHQLNANGYAIVLSAFLVTLIILRKKSSGRTLPFLCWRKVWNRFRKPFPLAFLILATLVFIGGVIHPPSNYDALTYRIPRILHWLAAGQWHWIHTMSPRLNNRSCGIEWVSAAFIALFQTDRLLFVISFISLLLLPGLTFSVFRRLGVRSRVAWYWMWIVPTGYCFLLQSGGIGNDVFGAPFALAAVDFALRAKNSRSPSDFFTSILAAAMMTSAKTSNLPLLLPWSIAVFPSLRIAARFPLKTLGVCVFAVFASVLPTIFFNAKFSPDWSGADLHRGTRPGDIVLRTAANGVIIPLQNLVPPIFPVAQKWNEAFLRTIPHSLDLRLHQVMTEKPAAIFALPELQIDENAGLGFGVSMLLLISFFAEKIYRQRARIDVPIWQRAIRWSSAIALLALMTQYGLTGFCRMLTPYYSLLIPIALVGFGHEKLVNKRWWRTTAFAVFPIAGLLLIVSPARPLFPIMAILSKFPNVSPRIREVYSVYHQRYDAFAPARKILPPDLKILGVITFDDPETSLWRPFGSRRVVHVCPEDTAANLKSHGIEYILIKSEEFGNSFPGTMEDWLTRMNARTIEKIPLDLRASVGPLPWHLAKLN